MIAKIWPIKASYKGERRKIGGKQGIKNSLSYIADEEKTSIEKDFLTINEDINNDFPIPKKTKENDIEKEIDYINSEKDIGKVINYMANEDKTKKSYISGYLCDPEFAVEQFMDNAEEICQMIGRNLNEDKGNVAYHIVQSFPLEQNISDDEVHQCGVELCKKLGAHQAVICSHLRPTLGEDGKLHGKQKHNHILINSYIHPDFIDIEHPNRVKYNDCKETYEQLQIWNDEIALEHGFPIISEPQQEHYSWYEKQQENEGKSWKKQIRLDIHNTKLISTNWDEFKVNMKAAGYELKEGKYVTYTAPDKEHKTRDKTLGDSYTKKALIEYWELRKKIHEEIIEEIDDNKNNEQKDNLRIMIQIPDQQIFVRIPLDKKKTFLNEEPGETVKKEAHYNYLFPISKKSITDKKTLKTYFIEDKTYDLCDQEKQKIGEISGKNILDFLVNKEHLKEYSKKNKKEIPDESIETKAGYYQKNRYNTKTGKHYSINLYSPDGRKRSLLELMLLLAIVIIRNENDYWNKKTDTYENKNLNNPYYGKKDWKVQNMIDTLHIAREMNIKSPKEIDDKLEDAGRKFGRVRFQLSKTEKTIKKMNIIANTVTKYENVKPKCEVIWQTKDQTLKEKLIQENIALLNEYKTIKAALYKYNIKDDNDLTEFMKRWRSINQHHNDLKEKYHEVSEEYRSLKKLQYHTKLSQDEHYIYGPDYVYDKTIWEKTRGQSKEKEHNI